MVSRFLWSGRCMVLSYPTGVTFRSHASGFALGGAASTACGGGAILQRQNRLASIGGRYCRDAAMAVKRRAAGWPLEDWMTATQLIHARRAFGALLALVAAASVAGCGDDKAKQAARGPAAAVPVTLAPARIGPLQRSVDVVGTLFGEEDATISNKVNG